MKILEFENLTKRFYSVTALNRVSFSVNEGEILGIAGENGAGKSTLMQIISGVYPAGSFEGTIKLSGKPVSFHSPRDSERAGIAMIYQELSMHWDMSVAENLFLSAWPKKKTGLLNWGEMFSRAVSILDEIGISGIDPRLPIRELSKAQQQMVAICRALRAEPRILIMDEPTAALPQKEVDRLFEVVRQLKNKGMTVLLITHKLDEIMQNCDRVVVLRNGEFVAAHEIGQTTAAQLVTEMIGRSLKTMYPKETVAIGEEVLRVEHACVRHPFNPQKNILEDISFSLRKGEILGLEGLVGSGRSELLNAIYGKDALVKGSVFVEGQKVRLRSERDALKNGIALVTEDRRDDGFVGYMDIEQNITLASLDRVSRAGFILPQKELAAAAGFMRDLKIKAPSLQEPVSNLSGGNQQKVVLSKCLMTEPKIMLLDEPTRGVDVGAKTEIYRIMTELARRGIGIVFTSSERAELLEMCDRIIILANGKVCGSMDRTEFDERKIVQMEVSGADAPRGVRG